MKDLKKTIILTLFICVFFIFIYTGRFTIALVENDSRRINQSAYWLIEHVFGWDYQDTANMPLMDYLLIKYKLKKIVIRQLARIGYKVFVSL